jgi:hypothetical protein
MTHALVQFAARHYCAGAEFDRASKRCLRAAPIIKWMVGKHWRECAAYAKDKGIAWEVVG